MNMVCYEKTTFCYLLTYEANTKIRLRLLNYRMLVKKRFRKLLTITKTVQSYYIRSRY